MEGIRAGPCGLQPGRSDDAPRARLQIHPVRRRNSASRLTATLTGPGWGLPSASGSLIRGGIWATVCRAEAQIGHFDAKWALLRRGFSCARISPHVGAEEGILCPTFLS